MDDGFAMGYALGQDSGGNRNSGGMFDGNGSWIWIIVVFALLFGWGNNGNGNGQGANNGSGGGFGMPTYIPYPVGGAALQGAVTRSDLCSEFNFNGLENSVRGIQQGICDSTFALNNTITGGNNATQMAMMQGFNGVGNAVCDLGYNIQQGFNAQNVAYLQGQNALQTQLADCCCRTNNNIERGFADVGYRMATDACAIQTSMANSTRDIIDSQQAGTRAIPADTTINAPVVVTIGTGAEQYPLTNRCCAQVTACGIRTRTRYSTVVSTNATGGTFRLLGRTCPCPSNQLTSIDGTVPAEPTPPAS